MFSKIYEFFCYREMLKSLVKKDLKTRYKGSLLGFFWTFLNPLLQLLVYATIFPLILKNNQPNYAMFLFVALVPWTYFSQSTQGSSFIIIGNSNLVTKIYFPREIIPISFSVSGLVNMLFSFLIVIPMLIIMGVQLTIYVLWLPLLLLIQFILCSGLSLMVSAINVYFRDLESIIGILVMALYFTSPIIYDISSIPEQFRIVLNLNPMTGLITNYRNVLFYGLGLNVVWLLHSLVFSVGVFILGYYVFNRLQKRFAEIL